MGRRKANKSGREQSRTHTHTHACKTRARSPLQLAAYRWCGRLHVLDELEGLVEVVLAKKVDDEVEACLWDDVNEFAPHLQCPFAVTEHNLKAAPQPSHVRVREGVRE